MSVFTKLNKPNKDGTTLKSHLIQAFKNTGKKPKDLEEVNPPAAFVYLWDWFWELDHSRDRSMTCAPLTYEETYFWQKLNEVKLFPWELEALRMMDRAYCREVNK
jgi:hypothetical protein